MPARRFPPPWSVEEYNDACFIVRDNDGQQFAYVYFGNPRAAPKPFTCVFMSCRYCGNCIKSQIASRAETTSAAHDIFLDTLYGPICTVH